jgi:prevent-host-death family protein
MAELALSDAGDRLAEVIDLVRRSGEPIFVTRGGHRVAVIVGAEVFEQLVDAAGEVTDREELHAACVEDEYVPWDEVKADLDLG